MLAAGTTTSFGVVIAPWISAACDSMKIFWPWLISNHSFFFCGRLSPTTPLDVDLGSEKNWTATVYGDVLEMSLILNLVSSIQLLEENIQKKSKSKGKLQLTPLGTWLWIQTGWRLKRWGELNWQHKMIPLAFPRTWAASIRYHLASSYRIEGKETKTKETKTKKRHR